MTPRAFIAGSGWVFAKTMPQWPHEYTVRDLTSPDARGSTCLSHESFEWFVHLIRSEGYQARWGRYNNTYLEIDGWKYWTMGAAPEETTIINRERL